MGQAGTADRLSGDFQQLSALMCTCIEFALRPAICRPSFVATLVLQGCLDADAAVGTPLYTTQARDYTWNQVPVRR